MSFEYPGVIPVESFTRILDAEMSVDREVFTSQSLEGGMGRVIVC